MFVIAGKCTKVETENRTENEGRQKRHHNKLRQEN